MIKTLVGMAILFVLSFFFMACSEQVQGDTRSIISYFFFCLCLLLAFIPVIKFLIKGKS